jgi:hypothetical protein
VSHLNNITLYRATVTSVAVHLPACLLLISSTNSSKYQIPRQKTKTVKFIELGWTVKRIYQPVYINLYISTCIYQPVYINLYITTCIYQPVYINLYISTCIYQPVYPWKEIPFTIRAKWNPTWLYILKFRNCRVHRNALLINNARENNLSYHLKHRPVLFNSSSIPLSCL